MSKPRTGIALLVAGVAVADLVVAVVLDPGRTPFSAVPEPVVMATEALAFSQVGLLAIWLVFGGRTEWATWRLAATWPVLAFWCRLLRFGAPLGDWHIEAAAYAVVFLSQGAAVAVPLFAGRYHGLALRDADAARPESFQFTLGTLLLGTTGLAVFFALLSYAVSFDVLWDEGADWLFPLVAFGTGHAAIVLAALWAVLGRGRPIVRWLAFVIVMTAFWAVHSAVTYTPPDPAQTTAWWWPMCRQAIVLAAEALLLAGCLWAVRISGFRLLRSTCDS
jgi:hypothetical protein